MLLPALNSARDRARSISCVNNMKTMALFLQYYTDDHADNFPWVDSTHRLWSFRLFPYYSKAKVPWHGWERSSQRNDPLTVPFKVDMCPSYISYGKPVAPDSNGWYLYQGYTSNVYLGYFNRGSGYTSDPSNPAAMTTKYYKRTQVLKPGGTSSMMCLYGPDQGGWISYNYAAGNSGTVTCYPHQKSRNVQFVDGHVTPLRYGEIPFWSGTGSQVARHFFAYFP